MTDKELLYTMDAVNHLKHFTDMCNDFKRNLTDENCKRFVESIAAKTVDSYAALSGLVKNGGNH